MMMSITESQMIQQKIKLVYTKRERKIKENVK